MFCHFFIFLAFILYTQDSEKYFICFAFLTLSSSLYIAFLILFCLQPFCVYVLSVFYDYREATTWAKLLHTFLTTHTADVYPRGSCA